MNPHEILRRFPNASKSLLDANKADYGTGVPSESAGTTTKLECDPIRSPLRANQDKETSPRRLHLRIVSVRKRLIDPDNLSPKYLIDCLRYAGAIPDDAAKDITLEVSQRRVERGETEHTLVEIFSERQ